MSNGLAYTGVVIDIQPIAGADRIVSAKVACGHGGIWNVVVPIGLETGHRMTVFLPDALLPQVPELAFMEKDKYRVRMRRMKGAPSEALAVTDFVGDHKPGDDVTEELGVTKYEKPIPMGLQGEIVGYFPDHLIHRTDEPRVQLVPEMLEMLQGVPCTVTLKIDGSSITTINDGVSDHIRVCSRNVELRYAPNNLAWKLTLDNGFDKKLYHGSAVQWELAGPKVQDNRLQLKQHRAYVFNLYDMSTRAYLSYPEMLDSQFAEYLVPAIWRGRLHADQVALQEMADSVRYGNNPGEGIVVRPDYDMRTPAGDRVSFKVISLLYKEAK